MGETPNGNYNKDEQAIKRDAIIYVQNLFDKIDQRYSIYQKENL